MIKSMTGYGSAIHDGDSFSINAVASSVNHRFLDVQVRLPESLTALDGRMRRKVQEFCQRGRVTINIDLVRKGDTASGYELNRPLVNGYLNALRLLKDEYSLDGQIDINCIANLPGVIQPPAMERAQGGVEERVLVIAEQALSSMAEMRAVEGQELRRDFLSRLDSIAEWVAAIEAEAATFVEHYRQKLLKRIADYKNDVQVDPARLAQEVVFHASRADISEELVRLRSHLEQFRALVDADEAVGKKLDFLLQEMNREANTILAKSGELKISRPALEIKAELEKLKEQVQNVE
jgi:uncharacterized protein (TIGR00255 family)